MNNQLHHSLYYECHVTIEPVFGKRLEEFKQLCTIWGFRVAKLVMEKGPNRKDSFCTGRSKSVEDLELRMSNLIIALQRCEFKIFRYKIENCILDVTV